MSSGCGDVISLEGMKTIKLHQTFEAEVITGHAGGVWSGAEIDTATNSVTGQVQKTLPAIIRDIGFERASFDFSTGGTLGIADRNKIVYNPADNNWYSWSGTLPKIVSAGEDPTADANWKPRTDQLLRQELATASDDSGGALLAMPQGGTIADAVKYITPYAFKHLVVGDNWTPALAAADSAAQALGVPLDGQGYTYTLGSSVVLRCAKYRNLTLRPATGYAGAAPIFIVNTSTGFIEHDNVDISNFVLTGCKFLQGSYVGDTTAVFKGLCRYNNNGNLVRTTITADINTATAYILSVTDASAFKANDPVHVGDGRYKILSISGNSITLYNDGTGATLFDSGTRYQQYAGQYVTLNQGYDNNGLRIGDNTQGWNIDVSGIVEAIGNGWTGFYHNSGQYGGYQKVANVRASGNGYIGIGLGYVNKGYVRNCITEFNGNNGIDLFESKMTVLIDSNISVGNGVDNLFAGGNGEVAHVTGNTLLNAHRIGALIFGRISAISGADLYDNKFLGNKFRSIGFTGVRYGSIVGGRVGGASNYSIFIEGKSGLRNPDKIVIRGVDMFSSTAGDIGGNLRNNTDYPAGTVDIIDNNTFDRMPTTSISNTNYYGCKFYPEYLLAGTSEVTAPAGSIISVNLIVRRPNNSAVVAAAAAEPITMSISSASDGASQSNVTSATKNQANIVELLNNASTRGKIIAIPDSGTLSYNFSLSEAGTRYILAECGGFRKLLTLTWT